MTKLIFIIAIMLIPASVCAQEPSPLNKELTSQRTMVQEIEFLRAKVKVLEDQAEVLSKTVELQKTLTGLMSDQINFLKEAIEQRKSVEDIYEKRMALKDQEIALKDTAISLANERAEKAERRKGITNIIYGVLGILIGRGL